MYSREKESVCVCNSNSEGIPRSSANRPSEEETYFSCRDNARSNASFVVVVVVAFFFSVSSCPTKTFLLLPSVSKSFPEEDIFSVAREKDEKKEKKGLQATKKNVPDRREKEKRKVFWTPPLFFVVLYIKNQNPQSALLVAFVSFLLFFLRLFVFLSPRSIHSSHFSLVARAYIYLETRDLDEFLERRDEKKREGKKT